MITDMTLKEAMGSNWRPGVNWALQAAARIKVLKDEIESLAACGLKAEDGVARIRMERERQKTVEGWTPEHDDEQDDGELARAAAAYALGRSWWKPSAENRIRELEKAGALIAAEIDRLQRRAKVEFKIIMHDE